MPKFTEKQTGNILIFGLQTFSMHMYSYAFYKKVNHTVMMLFSPDYVSIPKLSTS